MRSHRCKNVSAMEGLADSRKKIFLFVEAHHLFSFLPLCDKGEKAIVRPYKKIILSDEKNRLPLPPYPRVHHREVDRPYWKIRIGIGQYEGSFLHLMWTYLMGNINEGALRIDLQNHPLHRSHIRVFCAEVGEQSDNRLPHQALFEVRRWEFR